MTKPKIAYSKAKTLRGKVPPAIELWCRDACIDVKETMKAEVLEGCAFRAVVCGKNSQRDHQTARESTLIRINS